MFAFQPPLHLGVAMWLSSGQQDGKVVEWVFLKGSIKQDWVAGEDFFISRFVLFSTKMKIWGLEFQFLSWTWGNFDVKSHKLGKWKERQKGTWAPLTVALPYQTWHVDLHTSFIFEKNNFHPIEGTIISSLCYYQIYFISETFRFTKSVIINIPHYTVI